MKIGIVVHGPQIIDSGYALNIIKQLEKQIVIAMLKVNQHKLI